MVFREIFNTRLPIFFRQHFTSFRLSVGSSRVSVMLRVPLIFQATQKRHNVWKNSRGSDRECQVESLAKYVRPDLYRQRSRGAEEQRGKRNTRLPLS